MKNFARENSSEKKTWGVLGKIQTYEIPNNALGKTIVPLNDNAFAAWDASKSNYRLRPHMPNNQGGVVPQETPTPDVSPTPTGTSSATPTPTPTQTGTPTGTPTPTPSSTPAFPTPALWYDATNLGSIDYITTGGTDLVSTWRSIGVYQKALTGSTTTNNSPVWSASTVFPGSPRVVRFVGATTTADSDFLTQRFDSTEVPYVSGATLFVILAKPDGATYTRTVPGEGGFGHILRLLQGNTTTGGWTNITNAQFLANYNATTNDTIVATFNTNGVSQANTLSLSSGFFINGKLLQKVEYAQNLQKFSMNDNVRTPQTGPNVSVNSYINQVSLGAMYPNTGILSPANANVEVGEIMFFNTPLDSSQILAVESYLKTKWGYTSW